MSSVNKVVILGNVGSIDTKQNPSGDPITHISVATSESWKDKQGEKQTKTEWHRIILFGNAAKFCSKYGKKGDKVYVEGKLTTRKWTDKQGVDKYITEILVDNFSGDFKILSSNKKEDDDADKHNKDNAYVEDDIATDDIPF